VGEWRADQRRRRRITRVCRPILSRLNARTGLVCARADQHACADGVAACGLEIPYWLGRLGCGVVSGGRRVMAGGLTDAQQDGQLAPAGRRVWGLGVEQGAARRRPKERGGGLRTARAAPAGRVARGGEGAEYCNVDKGWRRRPVRAAFGGSISCCLWAGGAARACMRRGWQRPQSLVRVSGRARERIEPAGPLMRLPCPVWKGGAARGAGPRAAAPRAAPGPSAAAQPSWGGGGRSGRSAGRAPPRGRQARTVFEGRQGEAGAAPT
jgi:hypothetical protein